MGTPNIPTKCKVCNREFLTWPYRLKDGPICCSRACGSISHPSNHKGKKWNQQSRERLSKAKDKGSTQYSAIHKWLVRIKGSPKICEKCGLNDPNVRYEWSNNSGEYKRDVKDYERLCVPCHRKKDGHDKFYQYSSLWQKGAI